MKPAAVLLALALAPGCAPDPPSVTYRYRRLDAGPGLSRISGTVTNHDARPRTLVLTIDCGDGETRDFRVRNVAPGGSAEFEEFTLCQGEGYDVSISRTSYAD